VPPVLVVPPVAVVPPLLVDPPLLVVPPVLVVPPMLVVPPVLVVPPLATVPPEPDPPLPPPEAVVFEPQAQRPRQSNPITLAIRIIVHLLERRLAAATLVEVAVVPRRDFGSLGTKNWWSGKPKQGSLDRTSTRFAHARRPPD